MTDAVRFPRNVFNIPRACGESCEAAVARLLSAGVIDQAAADEILAADVTQAATSPVGPQDADEIDRIVHMSGSFPGFRLALRGRVWTIEGDVDGEWVQRGGHFRNQSDAIGYLNRDQARRSLRGFYGDNAGLEVSDDLHASKDRGLHSEAQFAAPSVQAVADEFFELPSEDRALGEGDGVESVLVGGHGVAPSGYPHNPKVGRSGQSSEEGVPPLTHDDVRAIVREEIERLAGRRRVVVGAADTFNQYAFDSAVAADAMSPLPPRRESATQPTLTDGYAESAREAGPGTQSEPRPPRQAGPPRGSSGLPQGSRSAEVDAKESGLHHSVVPGSRAADSSTLASPSVVDLGGSTVGDGQAAEGDPQPSAAEPLKARPTARAHRFRPGLIELAVSTNESMFRFALADHDANSLRADLAKALTA